MKCGNASALSAVVGECESNSIAAVGPAKIKKSPIVVVDNYDSFTYNLCQVSFCFSC